jgi:hypothetical protein
MKLTSLTSADFKEIIGLLEEKKDLQAQVAKIDAGLAAYEIGEPVTAATGKQGRKPGPQPSVPAHRKPRTAKRAKRGAVKAAIIDLIKGAGKSGITVKAIAARLGVNYNRVFTWFYGTGKTVKQIEKIAPGKYAWLD